MSQSLAVSEGRPIAETKLWAEVSGLCRKAKLPLNKEAPDFVVMTTGAPILDVIRIIDDQSAAAQLGPDGDPSSLFAVESEEVLEPPPSPSEKKPARRGKVARERKR